MKMARIAVPESVADCEIPEREQPDQQKGEENLRHRPQHHIDAESARHRGQGLCCEGEHAPEVNQRQRPCVEEARGGCGDIAELTFEVFLKGRA